jgi:hypothetical protein
MITVCRRSSRTAVALVSRLASSSRTLSSSNSSGDNKDNNKPKNAIVLVGHMLKSQVKLPVLDVEEVIRKIMFLRTNNMTQCWNMYQTVPPAMRSVSLCKALLVPGLPAKNALEVWDQLGQAIAKSEDKKLAVADFHDLFMICSGQEDAEDAALLRLQKNGFEPDLTIRVILLKGALTRKDLDLALARFEEFKACAGKQNAQVAVGVYNQIILLAINAGEDEVASSILKEMLQKGIQPDLGTLKCTLHQALLHREYEKGRQIYEEIKRQHFKVDHSTLYLYASSCIMDKTFYLAIGRDGIANTLLKDVKTYDIPVQKDLWSLLLNLHENGFDLMQQCLMWNIPFTEEEVHLAIKYLLLDPKRTTAGLALAFECIKLADNHEIIVRRETLNMLILACISEKQTKSKKKHQLLSMGKFLIIDLCKSVGFHTVERIASILSNMKISIPEVELYSANLRAMMKETEVE